MSGNVFDTLAADALETTDGEIVSDNQSTYSFDEVEKLTDDTDEVKELQKEVKKSEKTAKPVKKEVKTADEVVLPQPVRDDYGQILVKAARATKPNIKLPLNKPKIQRGLKQKVVNSIAWLATWCLRLIKMFPQRVRYDSSTS